MKNNILKVFLSLIFLFSIQESKNSQGSLMLVSEELINNLSDYDKRKVISEYAAYIVQYIIINSGLTEQIKTEEEANVLRNHIEVMIKKLISNSEFCNLSEDLIKEQLKKLNNYKKTKRMYNILKYLAPVSIFTMMCSKMFKNYSLFDKIDKKYFGYVEDSALLSSLMSIYLYIEQKSSKEGQDYYFGSGEFTSTEKSKELYILAYNNVISPYLEDAFSKKTTDENEVNKQEEKKEEKKS